ncbi:MAG: helix-turn-helix domain-containing protein [Bacteroidota bacterium]
MGRLGSFELFELASSRFDGYFGLMYDSLRFKSKSELAREMGISRETLRKKLKEIEGLETGRRQLLYPRELMRIYEEFVT